MNSPLVRKYVAELLMSYGARDAKNFEFEESLHDQLNGLWLDMSDEEHEECDKAARAATANYLMTSCRASTQYKLMLVNDGLSECIKARENITSRVFFVHEAVMGFTQEKNPQSKAKIDSLQVRDNFAKGKGSATKWWMSGTKASLFREQGEVYG